jgi:hypothetical protein
MATPRRLVTPEKPSCNSYRCQFEWDQTWGPNLGTKPEDRRGVHQFPFAEKVGNVPSVPGFCPQDLEWI